MKNLFYLLVLFTLFTGCKKNKDTFTLKGEIDGLLNDTLYLYAPTQESIDTIIARKNKFSYQATIDTSATFTLLVNGSEKYPVFADKGLTVRISGNLSSGRPLLIEGGETNDQLTRLRNELHELTGQPEKIEEKIDSFIRSYPLSAANIYLLDKYLLQTEPADYAKIDSLIKIMGGDLQDDPFVARLKDYLKKRDNFPTNKYAPQFSNKDQNGRPIASSDFKDQYLLIYFWASWCEDCRQTNQVLKELARTYKKEKFSILGVSLDTDKKTWLDAIKKDTLNWKHINDLKGWDNFLVSQYGIERLPGNALVSPKQEIIALNLPENGLKEKLKDIFKEKNAK